MTTPRGGRPLSLLSLALLSAALVFGASQAGRALLHSKQGLDLAPSVAAARASLETRGFPVYDWSALQEVGRRYGLHGPLGAEDPIIEYAYAPSTLLVYLPFAALPWPSARVIWFALSIAALLLAAHWWGRMVAPDGASPQAWGWGAVAATAVSFPSAYGWMAGQSNDFVLLLLVASFAAWRDGHASRAGWLAAPALLWKAFTGAPLLFWIVRSDRRALLAVVASMLALILVSTLLVEPRAWLEWWEYILSPAKGPTAAMRNHSISGVMQLWFTANVIAPPIADSPLLARVATWGLASLALGLAARTLAARPQPRDPHTAIQWSSTLVLAVLLVPRGWEHYGVLLLPAFISCASGIVSRPRSPSTLIAALLLGAAFSTWALLLMDRDDYTSAAAFPLVLGSKMSASLLLLGISAWLIHTRPRAIDRDADRRGIRGSQAALERRQLD